MDDNGTTRISQENGMRAPSPSLCSTCRAESGRRVPPPDVTAVQSAQRRLIESRPSSALAGRRRRCPQTCREPGRAGRPLPDHPLLPAAPREPGLVRLTWTIKLGAAVRPFSPPPPSDRRASGSVQAGDVLPGWAARGR
ncbi:unnamed protein product [Rangifer tarandus platyrhynchus]|uniref:Uncharacterized protein n=1 Tax=Rangifer tarandus platyrhynchus TaxID=3082113 RepID=A0ABN8ZDU7_RANTA|nr:unnamed protein product [Rangifer tarandus platyrhynchus]